MQINTKFMTGEWVGFRDCGTLCIGKIYKVTVEFLTFNSTVLVYHVEVNGKLYTCQESYLHAIAMPKELEKAV